MTRSSTMTVCVAVCACLLGVLTACTASTAPRAPETVGVPTQKASADPSATPTGATASARKSEFDAAAQSVIDAHKKPGGKDFINALVAAGFDKTHMQVTPDRTSIGYEAGSVQFSVRVGDQCLIGQYGYGAKKVGYHSLVTPVLSTGACLIGRTRAIDW